MSDAIRPPCVDPSDVARLEERLNALRQSLDELKEYLETRYMKHLEERVYNLERRVKALEGDLERVHHNADTRFESVATSVAAVTNRIARIVGVGIGVMAALTVLTFFFEFLR